MDSMIMTKYCRSILMSIHKYIKFKSLDRIGLKFSFVTAVAWIRFPASTCGRAAVARPRSVFPPGTPGSPTSKDLRTPTGILAFENTSIRSMNFP